MSSFNLDKNIYLFLDEDNIMKQHNIVISEIL